MGDKLLVKLMVATDWLEDKMREITQQLQELYRNKVDQQWRLIII